MRRVQESEPRLGRGVGSNLSSFASPSRRGEGPCPRPGCGDRRSPSPVPYLVAGGKAKRPSGIPAGQLRTEALDRAEKAELVADLNQALSRAGVLVVAHYSGLNVAQMSTLRGRMREAGGSLKVAKNRLVKLALKGTDLEHVSDLFQGPTVIAYSDDVVAAPKVAAEFAKTNQAFVLLGGAMGKTALDANGVEALASLPSLDELRARLVGMLQTPATRVAGVLQAPAAQLARVLGAYARKDEAA